jgi:hypothetical protein
MITKREQGRIDAAEIIRRILEALPLPASVAGYLRGHADGLEAGTKHR